VSAIPAGSLTLNQVLARLGYATRPAKQYAKDILDARGAVVCTGNAGDVWDWLFATGQVQR